MKGLIVQQLGNDHISEDLHVTQLRKGIIDNCENLHYDGVVENDEVRTIIQYLLLNSIRSQNGEG